MIECKFVLKGSDSIQSVCQVHVVPQIGQAVAFVNGQQGIGYYKVTNVEHYIYREEGAHEIVVTYE